MYIPEDAELFMARDRKIAIIYRRMPGGVTENNWGFTIKEESLYTVIINADISLHSQNHVLGHELAHIFCGHFEMKDVDPEFKENEANEKAWEYYELYKERRL